MGYHQSFVHKFYEALQASSNEFTVSQLITLKRKEFLVRKGQRDMHLYLVKEGTFRIFHETAEEDFTIRFGYPGSFLAVFPTFFNEAPTQYNIQALKEAKVEAIHKNIFFKTINNNASLNQMWQQSLQYLILDQLEREIDLLTASPKERFERVLKRSPKLFQEIPNKYIASYLRMTPETLSRLKKR